MENFVFKRKTAHMIYYDFSQVENLQKLCANLIDLYLEALFMSIKNFRNSAPCSIEIFSRFFYIQIRLRILTFSDRRDLQKIEFQVSRFDSYG